MNVGPVGSFLANSTQNLILKVTFGNLAPDTHLTGVRSMSLCDWTWDEGKIKEDISNISWIIEREMSTDVKDQDTKEVDVDDGYVAPKLMTAEQMKKLDADDEALNRYKVHHTRCISNLYHSLPSSLPFFLDLPVRQPPPTHPFVPSTCVHSLLTDRCGEGHA